MMVFRHIICGRSLAALGFLLLLLFSVGCAREFFNFARYGGVELRLSPPYDWDPERKVPLRDEEIKTALQIVDGVCRKYGLSLKKPRPSDGSELARSYEIIFEGPPYVRDFACFVYLLQKRDLLRIGFVERFYPSHQNKEMRTMWLELESEFFKRFGKDKVREY